jgi:hypothetical protein
MKKFFFIIISLILLIIIGCEIGLKDQQADLEISQEDFNTAKSLMFSDNMQAFQRAFDSVSSRSLNNEAMLVQVLESIYDIRFNNLLSINETLTFINENQVDVTGITFIDDEQDLSGGVPLYVGINTTKTQIKQEFEKLSNRLKSNENLPDEYEPFTIDKVKISGIGAVILDDGDKEKLISNNLVLNVNPLYNDLNETSYTYEGESRSIFGSNTFEPDWHQVRIRKQAITHEVIFEWYGKWTTSSRISKLHQGPTPAFEPDQKLKCSMLGPICLASYAQINPRANNHPWASNMPHAYLDTQLSDGSERSWCVGSTSSELMTLNTEYWWHIYSPEGNSTSTNWRKASYELQHWDETDQNYPEGDPFAVGFFVEGNKWELLVYSMGTHIADFILTF